MVRPRVKFKDYGDEVIVRPRRVRVEEGEKVWGKEGGISFSPTAEQRVIVDGLVAAGMIEKEIATTLGIDEKTLRLHFPLELARSPDTAGKRVAGKLFRTAVYGGGKESVEAAKFWLSCKAGWKQTNVTEHTGAGGDAIRISAEIGELTNEERAIRLLQLINRVRVGGSGSAPPVNS